jgi:hypothetical protein
MRRVYWKLDPSDTKLRKTWMDANHGLAWLNSYEPKALALVSGKHAILLTGKLEPIGLNGNELQAAMARLERDGGGLPRGLSELADWIKLSPPMPRESRGS